MSHVECPNASTRTTAYRLGFQARVTGFARESCPVDPDTSFCGWYDWRAGWDDANYQLAAAE